MAQFTRTKKLTEASYSPTNPASEAAIRSEVDGSIQEIADILYSQTAGKGASQVGLEGLTQTDLQEFAEWVKPYVDAGLLANKTGDHTGTWQGYSPTATDPGIQAVVDEHTIQLEEIISANSRGALSDKTTDNTTSIKESIDYCFKNGKSLIIRNGTKWYLDNIQNYKNGTITVDDSVVLYGIDTTGDDYVGGFVFNLTDKSYGIISSFDSNSVTVSALYLGSNNSFTIGDEYQISLLKKDVTIFDDSRFDPFSNTFTGQSKVFLNSDNPHVKPANEYGAYGQYHPAFVVSNTSNSKMEARASFVARNYVDSELKNYIQIGINPNNNTEDTTLIDYLVVVGNDKGGTLNSKVALGILQPEEDASYFGIGTRGVSGYSVYQKHDRNETNKLAFNANGTQRTEFEFMNNGVTLNTIRHWQSLNGFTGLDTVVFPRSSNISVDGSLYGGAMFTNEGSSGTVTVTITSGSRIGTSIELAVVNSFSLRLQTSGSETFVDLSTLISSNTPGDYLRAKKITATKWVITDKLGTWS